MNDIKIDLNIDRFIGCTEYTILVGYRGNDKKRLTNILEINSLLIAYFLEV